ncbi:MAG: hypothetical protein GY913_35670 [Proteobacteria bacterium]|nr:hypothetical protein [Pseudomonadota bacterium]MCP4922272.1 hypothetical protein [Pseudomonadota bacterium]
MSTTIQTDYRVITARRDYIGDSWLLAEFRSHVEWLAEGMGSNQNALTVYEHDDSGWDAVQDDGKTGRLDYADGLRRGRETWWDADGDLWTERVYDWADDRLTAVTGTVDSSTYEYDERGMPLQTTWLARDQLTVHAWDCP